MYVMLISGKKVTKSFLQRHLAGKYIITDKLIILRHSFQAIAVKVIPLLIAMVIMATMSACSFGGHSVNVTVGNNGCNIAPCTSQPIETNITIK